eukprot:1185054-Prorocentrum_minimum.AAC.1
MELMYGSGFFWTTEVYIKIQAVHLQLGHSDGLIQKVRARLILHLEHQVPRLGRIHALGGPPA